jgi:aminopeptidase
MRDPRMTALAELLVNTSCRVKEGEKVLIEALDTPEAFTIELIAAARRAGALPFVSLRQNRVLKHLYQQCTESQMQEYGEIELYRMKKMDAYIGVRGSLNFAELSDVLQDRLKLVNRLYFKPVHLDQRVRHTKWVVLRWPSPSMAQQANMSTDAFEDFFYSVCILDYSRMSRAMEALVARLERADQVEIKGPATDLSFSIKGIPVKKCDGQHNIPDGEVFTAPVKESVRGTIQFNAPTLFHGFSFNRVFLRFLKGKVVEASASTREETDRLISILDSEEGARYVGEFALGLNPRITKPIRDVLFDEKIAGSVHLALGQAYEDADNGNRSEIHWDMVRILTKEYGGGELLLDGTVIQHDGLFVAPELQDLNPERLL